MHANKHTHARARTGPDPVVQSQAEPSFEFGQEGLPSEHEQGEQPSAEAGPTETLPSAAEATDG